MKIKGTTVVYQGLAAFVLLFLLAACSTTSTPSSPTQETTFTLEEIANLTPEQIAQLDETQMEAINQTVQAELGDSEKLLASASSELSPTQMTSASNKWPNYDLTRTYAVDFGAAGYLQYVRFSYPGPKWGSDGCKDVPKAEDLFNILFTNACIHHDFGYGNLPQYKRGRTEEVRKQIDARFLTSMQNACTTVNSNFRILCNIYAARYSASASVYGKSRYYSTPVKFN